VKTADPLRDVLKDISYCFASIPELRVVFSCEVVSTREHRIEFFSMLATK
jgi:hypothetical protein